MPQNCGHCGRAGTIEPVKNVELSSDTQEVAFSGTWIEQMTTTEYLNVSRCTVCRGLVLTTSFYIDGWQDPSEVTYKPLYPDVRDGADLPRRVRQRYEAMLELLFAPDAFAVRAGLVLEAVCADQGVAKGTLDSRLKKLVADGAVPHGLVEQAHLVRQYRNIGGHDDDIEVEDEDVPLIRGFVEALLEFLYWGPAKLARGRDALARRRATT